MMLNPPKCVLALVLGALATMAVQRHASEREGHLVSCEIALDFIKHKLAKAHRPIFFVESNFAPFSRDEIERRRRASPPELRNHPDFALALRQVELAGISPVRDCLAVSEFLDAKRVAHPSVEQSQALARAFDGKTLLYPFEIVSISMPALDRVQGKAWFNVELECGPLCGGSFAIEYQFSNSRWKLEKEVQTAIA